MRKCSICKTYKSFNCFGKDKHNKSGFCCRCKDCIKIIREKNKDYYKIYRQKNKIKQNIYCKEYNKKNKLILKEKRKNKPISKEYKQYRKEYEKQYRKNNKVILNKKIKKYLNKNRNKISKYMTEYRKHNKDKIKLLMYNYFKNRKKNDILFRFKIKIHDLIIKSIKGKGYTKNSRTYTYLGCNFLTFKQHIENKFKEGMIWDNHGLWHFDHIYPNALCKTEDELIKNQHYTNFQPLWAKENIHKGAKII